MAERFNAPVLKTGDPKGSVGSNPTPSAKLKISPQRHRGHGENRNCAGSCSCVSTLCLGGEILMLAFPVVRGRWGQTDGATVPERMPDR